MSLDRFNPVPDSAAPTSADRRIAETMTGQAEAAAAVLKAMSHEGRLMILCHLAGGEKSVTELEGLLGRRQAAVSQQLARLRLEGLVTTRREGKTIYYAVENTRVLAFVRALPALVSG
ncbi:ArsR/SmtB family transcription factor [Tabrizicola sp.]|uniref:ArsR/SmtB family transcription factor n=1 Tax=Tabrizicola sp. TaxID=2005166 RepID=UPI003F3AD5A8